MLEADADNSHRFEVNGIPFFSKGANYIPADAFANRVTPGILRRIVANAVAVNMNTLRFWGGGYYEEKELFERGLAPAVAVVAVEAEVVLACVQVADGAQVDWVHGRSVACGGLRG